MTDPLCMTPRELVLWHQANGLASPPMLSPCIDCPLSWAREMRAAGCCNGSPGEPVTRRRSKTVTERRRESNRLAARRWRERNPGRRS